MQRRAGWVIIGVLVTAAVVFGLTRDRGTRSTPGASEHAGPPSFVIIVMDTARRDRLSCYGYERETSPRLDELAATSTLFTNAHSTSSWTSPAHASLFTGLYPASHEVTQEHWKMNDDLTTLAEILGGNGYRTIGIIENPILSSEYGFQQGFSEYYFTGRMQRAVDRAGGGRSETGNLATDRFLKSIREFDDDTPYFIFVNLIAPHQPYDSSKQFMDTFVTDETQNITSNMWPEYYLGEKRFTPSELRHLNELYDAEILYTDHLVGLMMDGLRDQDLRDETVFIVTSDHGENIGDHEHMDHVFSLYRTTTTVPLIVSAPGRLPEGASDDRPVSLVDIFPTVLDMAGIDRGSHPNQGLSLTSDVVGPDRAMLSEYYFPEQAFGRYDPEDRESERLDPYRRRIRSLTAGDMKLVWGSDGTHEVYDLSVDPKEETNLLERGLGSDTLERLERVLMETVDLLEDESEVEPVSAATEELSEETKESLRSLGYIQ